VPHDLIVKFRKNRLALHRLARLDKAVFLNTGTSIDLATGEDIDRTDLTGEKTQTSLGPQIVVDHVTYILPVEGIIDLDAERTRIAKAIEAATKERNSLEGRLNNPAFVEKAKPEAVEKARADHAEKAAEAERLQAALARLG
jgi:valyl-tRNA synthetase